MVEGPINQLRLIDRAFFAVAGVGFEPTAFGL